MKLRACPSRQMCLEMIQFWRLKTDHGEAKPRFRGRRYTSFSDAVSQSITTGGDRNHSSEMWLSRRSVKLFGGQNI